MISWCLIPYSTKRCGAKLEKIRVGSSCCGRMGGRGKYGRAIVCRKRWRSLPCGASAVAVAVDSAGESVHGDLPFDFVRLNRPQEGALVAHVKYTVLLMGEYTNKITEAGSPVSRASNAALPHRHASSAASRCSRNSPARKRANLPASSCSLRKPEVIAWFVFLVGGDSRWQPIAPDGELKDEEILALLAQPVGKPKKDKKKKKKGGGGEPAAVRSPRMFSGTFDSVFPSQQFRVCIVCRTGAVGQASGHRQREVVIVGRFDGGECDEAGAIVKHEGSCWPC